jgi:hypothetical protein
MYILYILMHKYIAIQAGDAKIFDLTIDKSHHLCYANIAIDSYKDILWK